MSESSNELGGGAGLACFRRSRMDGTHRATTRYPCQGKTLGRGGRNAPLPHVRIRRMMPARQSRGLGALPCFGVLGEGVVSA